MRLVSAFKVEEDFQRRWKEERKARSGAMMKAILSEPRGADHIQGLIPVQKV
jgi:hypothetical protein